MHLPIEFRSKKGPCTKPMDCANKSKGSERSTDDAVGDSQDPKIIEFFTLIDHRFPKNTLTGYELLCTVLNSDKSERINRMRE